MFPNAILANWKLARVTFLLSYFVALPFVVGEDGPEPSEATECTSANTAIMRAESMARKERFIGALAFSRSGDPMIGEFSNAVLLRAFGEVPTDVGGL